jgi:protein tyrosine phosphatase
MYLLYKKDYFNTVLIGSDSNEITENNYVNASYIDGPIEEDKKMFIATQGPLINTIEAFWRMILYCDSKLIIMLTNTHEDNRVTY